MPLHAGSSPRFSLALLLTFSLCQPSAAQTANRVANLGRYLHPGNTIVVTDGESRAEEAQPAVTPRQLTPLINSRVRITVASIVELPGIVRMETGRQPGPLLSGDADSVTVRDGEGQVTTVPRPGRLVVGVFLRATDQTVIVARDDRSAITVPRAAITRLERSAGPRSRKFPVGIGLLAGAGVGAGIGYAIGSVEKCRGLFAPPGSPEIYPCLVRTDVIGAMLGSMVGAGAGALVGALVPLRKRWVRSSVESLVDR
jgi:hypothetical protein